MKFVKHERLSLQNHPEFNEKWVQDQIAEDPSILGLGDLILKDKERLQPRAGRLDLLLQDQETDRRFEVELQLGRTDESHIIRTLEYWDIERKRYPQYDHCAVIVAEDITSRFLNVIGLFNNTIPLIAIQMTAIAIGEQVALMFTTVLDELTRGPEEEEDAEPTNRAYWEAKAGEEPLAVTDALHQLARELDPDLELKYRKHSVGLAKGPINVRFAILRPRRKFVLIELRIKRTKEIDDLLDESGLEMKPYSRSGRYRVHVSSRGLKEHEPLIKDLLKRATEAGDE